MAENHPVAFQWAIDARESGAKLIHVDPRFTRTSAMADCGFRCARDRILCCSEALVRYVLENQKDFREYVLHYTNAAVILREDFRTRRTWADCSPAGIRKRSATIPKPGRTSMAKHLAARTLRMSLAHPFWRGRAGARGNDYHQDLTLQHPRCVYQVLKRHFSRYTPQMVEEACGVPQDVS